MYEHLLSNESDRESDSEHEAMDQDAEDKEEDDEEEGTVFSGIMGDLDKARFQLDEMTKIIDMLTGSGLRRELTYKLSAPMSYPAMTNRHFAAICSQKRDQMNGITDILQRGINTVKHTHSVTMSPHFHSPFQ